MKRFWKDVVVKEIDGVYEICLDERRLKTPLKSELHLPTRALAEAVAEEWRSVGDVVKPEAMLFTKFANSTIDYVPKFRGDMRDNLAAYVETDLLCYRADAPQALAEREVEAWDPWLEWAKEQGLELHTTQGILPIAQPEATKTRALALLDDLGQFDFMPMQEFISLTGSFVLGLALYRGEIEPEAAFELAHLETLFQEELWGVDEDAVALRATNLHTLSIANAFLSAAR